MRRNIAIILALALTLSAGACGSASGQKANTAAAEEAVETATVTAEAESDDAGTELNGTEANEAGTESNETTPGTEPTAPASEEETEEVTTVSVAAKTPGIANRKPLAGTEIKITDIEPLMIGQAENKEAATGCTVLICEDGMRAGLDVRGGGPASRESQLLNPLMSAQIVHAIVLSGGSAYGLGTANGVMTYLEEQGIGYDTGYALVPLVAQADIYDLSVGDPSVRPGPDMGYEAAKKALEAPNYQDGNYGAGCGASVGKIAGMDYAMKTGIGSYAVQVGDLKIGAIVVLNALGDVYDWRTDEFFDRGQRQ